MNEIDLYGTTPETIVTFRPPISVAEAPISFAEARRMEASGRGTIIHGRRGAGKAVLGYRMALKTAWEMGSISFFSCVRCRAHWLFTKPGNENDRLDRHERNYWECC